MAIHRFKVGDSKPVKVDETAAKPPKKTAKAVSKEKAVKTEVIKKDKPAKKSGGLSAPFRAVGRYFKNSWRELKQVRWPNRKEAWVMTLAVIIFSLALGGLIFLLDLGFTYLFKEVVL